MYVIAAITVVAVIAVVLALWIAKRRLEGFAEESKVCNGVYYAEIPDFLSREECDALIDASGELTPSEVGGSDESVLDTSIRKSMQTWYSPGDHRVADVIRTKTENLVRSTGCLDGIKTQYEALQVVRYDKRGKYDAHYDGDECDDECPKDQRLATLLVYLNDDFQGGHTHFPLLNASVVPKKGKALFFWVADGASRDLFEKTLHAGVPVTQGHKWIANQWIRSA